MIPTSKTIGGLPRTLRGGLLGAVLLSGAVLGVPALTPRVDAAPPPVPATCGMFVERYFGSTTKAGDFAPFTLVTEGSGRNATYAEPGNASTGLKLSKTLWLIGSGQELSGTGTQYFSDR